MNELLDNLSRPRDEITSDIVNVLVDNLCKIFTDSAKTTFGTFIPRKKATSRDKSKCKPWFNMECKFARQNYRKLRRKYKKIQNS